MLTEHTLNTLKALRLPGIAAAFEDQQINRAAQSLSFDERFDMLVDCELTWRENRRLKNSCARRDSNLRKHASKIFITAQVANWTSH